MSSASLENSSAAPGPSLPKFQSSTSCGGSVLWKVRYSINAASCVDQEVAAAAKNSRLSYLERRAPARRGRESMPAGRGRRRCLAIPHSHVAASCGRAWYSARELFFPRLRRRDGEHAQHRPIETAQAAVAELEETAVGPFLSLTRRRPEADRQPDLLLARRAKRLEQLQRAADL